MPLKTFQRLLLHEMGNSFACKGNARLQQPCRKRHCTKNTSYIRQNQFKGHEVEYFLNRIRILKTTDDCFQVNSNLMQCLMHFTEALQFTSDPFQKLGGFVILL